MYLFGSYVAENFILCNISKSILTSPPFSVSPPVLPVSPPLLPVRLWWVHLASDWWYEGVQSDSGSADGQCVEHFHRGCGQRPPQVLQLHCSQTAGTTTILRYYNYTTQYYNYTAHRLQVLQLYYTVLQLYYTQYYIYTIHSTTTTLLTDCRYYNYTTHSTTTILHSTTTILHSTTTIL